MAQQRLNLTRTGEDLLFYIDGWLQFSSRDEYIYHEMLTHPAAGILDGRVSSDWRALILGGGDGLAARELLHFNRCARIDLVDHDPGVIEHARTAFAALNRNALDDPRVSIRIGDAVKYLESPAPAYDLIVVDLTFPDAMSGARFFTADFFGRIKERLQGHGLLSFNALSPTRQACAYWSAFKTLDRAGLPPKPLHLSIPSFLAHGYDRWGFFLASPREIGADEFDAWRPVPGARFARKSSLFSSLKFPADSVWAGIQLGHEIKSPSDFLCLLGMPMTIRRNSDAEVDFSRNHPLRDLQDIVGSPDFAVRFDQDWIAVMVKVLRSMDLDRLFEEIGRKLHGLSDSVREQFGKLRAELPALLKEKVFNLERAGQLICVLLVVITLLNLAYPDSAYGKGSSSSSSSDYDPFNAFTPMSLVSLAPRTPFHCKHLQVANPDSAVSMEGKPYPLRRVSTDDDPPGWEALFYSIADDLFLTPSGRAFLVSPRYPGFYYLIRPDGFTLIQEGDESQRTTFMPNDPIVGFLIKNASLQLAALDKTIGGYRQWVDWTTPLRPVSGDADRESLELTHLGEIRSALSAVLLRFEGYHSENNPPPGSHYLAPGIHVSAEGVLLGLKARGWNIYPWGKYRGKGFPVAQPDSAVDRLLNDIVLKTPPGLDPAAVRLLKELKTPPR